MTSLLPGDEKWQEAKVLGRHQWAENLVTLTLDLESTSLFKPGQYARIATVGADGQRRTSYYSVASGPGKPLEFYVGKRGAFSEHFFNLQPGHKVFVAESFSGRVTLDKVADANTLWMLATGTGLAPFVAIIRGGLPRERFSRVVVAHGVQSAAHLGYASELHAIAREQKLAIELIPCITRDAALPSHALRGRLTDLLRDGSLERRAGAEIDRHSARVLLSGSPPMVRDVFAFLAERGLQAQEHVHSDMDLASPQEKAGITASAK